MAVNMGGPRYLSEKEVRQYAREKGAGAAVEVAKEGVKYAKRAGEVAAAKASKQAMSSMQLGQGAASDRKTPSSTTPGPTNIIQASPKKRTEEKLKKFRSMWGRF